MATTINTLAASTAIAADFRKQEEGELGTMFAAYKVAAKLPDNKARDAVVVAAVDSMNYDLADAAQAETAKNRKARGKVFFGASRFFTMPLDAFPADLRGEFVFAVGNNVTVSCQQLHKALKVARERAIANVPEAKASDMEATGGANYAWATRLNQSVDNSTAAPMLTIRGISEFWASRLAPKVAKRLEVEAKAKAEAEAAAALKLAADAAAADRQSSVPDAPKADAPKADAPKADAPKADAPKADAPKADAPKAPEADAPKAPEADAPKAPEADAPKAPEADAKKSAPGRPSMDPSNRTALSALVPLPLVAAYQGIAAPHDRAAQVKALVLRMLDDMSGKDVQAIVAEAIKAHDRKAKDAAPKAGTATTPRRAAPKLPVADATVALGMALGGE